MIRLRRTVLYVPADKPRALEKAARLAADAVIIDLEDAVLPDHKDVARAAAVASVGAIAASGKEVVIRVNGMDTPWYNADITEVRRAGVTALVLPKVKSAMDVKRVALRSGLCVWPMLETPQAILDAKAVAEAAASTGPAAMILGSNDLSAEVGFADSPSRDTLSLTLQLVSLAASAAGVDAIDGVLNVIDDEPRLRAEAEQVQRLGFAGKSVIHPAQIDPVNRVFSPSPAAIEAAERTVAAMRDAERRGAAVAMLDGRMVEGLHARAAERVVALAAAIADRTAPVEPETGAEAVTHEPPEAPETVEVEGAAVAPEPAAETPPATASAAASTVFETAFAEPDAGHEPDTTAADAPDDEDSTAEDPSVAAEDERAAAPEPDETVPEIDETDALASEPSDDAAAADADTAPEAGLATPELPEESAESTADAADADEDHLPPLDVEETEASEEPEATADAATAEEPVPDEDETPAGDEPLSPPGPADDDEAPRPETGLDAVATAEIVAADETPETEEPEARADDELVGDAGKSEPTTEPEPEPEPDNMDPAEADDIPLEASETDAPTAEAAKDDAEPATDAEDDASEAPAANPAMDEFESLFGQEMEELFKERPVSESPRIEADDDDAVEPQEPSEDDGKRSS